MKKEGSACTNICKTWAETAVTSSTILWEHILLIMLLWFIVLRLLCISQFDDTSRSDLFLMPLSDWSLVPSQKAWKHPGVYKISVIQRHVTPTDVDLKTEAVKSSHHQATLSVTMTILTCFTLAYWLSCVLWALVRIYVSLLCISLQSQIKSITKCI